MDAPSPAAATAAPGEAPALELDGLAGTRASAAAVPTAHDAATTHAGTSGEPPAEDAPPPAVTSPRAALPLKEPAPDDFLLLKVVGRGAFGKVLQVAHKRSPRVYAMKVMDKKFLSSSRGYLEMAQIERDVMTRLSHPYIVSLRYAFQTRDKVRATWLRSGGALQGLTPHSSLRLAHHMRRLLARPSFNATHLRYLTLLSPSYSRSSF